MSLNNFTSARLKPVLYFLQPYPPEEDIALMASDDGAYKAAQAHVERLKQEGRQRQKVVRFNSLSPHPPPEFFSFASKGIILP